VERRANRNTSCQQKNLGKLPREKHLISAASGLSGTAYPAASRRYHLHRARTHGVVSPPPSRCSLNRTPGPALCNRPVSVARRVSRHSTQPSLPTEGASVPPCSRNAGRPGQIVTRLSVASATHCSASPSRRGDKGSCSTIACCPSHRWVRGTI
jgi:hypothetical protein